MELTRKHHPNLRVWLDILFSMPHKVSKVQPKALYIYIYIYIWNMLFLLFGIFMVKCFCKWANNKCCNIIMNHMFNLKLLFLTWSFFKYLESLACTWFLHSTFSLISLCIVMILKALKMSEYLTISCNRLRFLHQPPPLMKILFWVW
jgi:hypothetical protein